MPMWVFHFHFLPVLRETLTVTISQIATADSLINTILPIVTGIAVDYFGPLATAIHASTVVLLGTILSAVGASVSSYPLVLVGHIVLGFGSTTIETVQSKIYSFYSVGMMGFV
jgi:MFS family permease